MSDVQTSKSPAPKPPTKPPVDDGIPDQLRRIAPQTYEVHPIATIFPRLGDAEIKTLADDIKANGLREPIRLYEGKIIDGVNRAEACKLAEVEIRTWDYDGNDPIGFVLSANLHRRHLNASQRALVAASLSNLGIGANQTTPGTSIEVAAELLKVGRASVERALIVLKSGDTKVIEEVKSGAVAVSKAATQVKSGKTKRKTTKSAKASLKEVVDFIATWDQFDGWQKRNFIKRVKEQLVELIEEMETEEAAKEEADEEQTAATA